jgi:tricorn protease
MQLRSLILCILGGWLGLLPAQDGSLLRDPVISPDGQTVAFSYQGDIWTVAREGGKAQRLTIHEAYEARPQFSPDGQQIAFSSDRYGHGDIYVMDIEGSLPQRLTHHSANDRVTGWIGNDRIIFETDRTFVQVERENELHTVNVSGGTPERLLDAVGFDAVLSPDGRFIAFVRGTCRLSREDYEGPANRDLWLYVLKTNRYLRLTDFEGQDFSPQWAGNDQLYFLSARNGRYNVHQLSLSDEGSPQGEPEALTNFTDHGIRHFSASPDGQHLVFERMTDIFYMQPGQEPQPIEAQVTQDYRFDPVEHKRMSSEVEAFAVSPNGSQVAAIIRGEVVLMMSDQDQSRAVNVSKHPYRDRDVKWLSDSTLIFASDREGQYDLYLLRSADPEESDLYRTLKREAIRLTETEGDERSPVVSPDGKQVAYTRDRGMLLVAEVENGQSLGTPRTLLDGWDTPGGVAWSPDSRWLAYDLSDLDFNSEIYIHPVAEAGDPVNVSMHPRRDYDPVWSPDGSKLGFLSVRNNGDSDLWFAWLKEEDYEKTQRDWEELAHADDKEEEGEAEQMPLTIDLVDIHERLAQVTALPGNEGNLAIGKKGDYFYFTTNGSGRTTGSGDRDLMQIKWDGSEMKALTTGNQGPYAVRLSGKKQDHLYFLKRGGSLASVKVPGGSVEGLSFSVMLDIDHPAEMRQIFEEGWRVLEDGFYDPEFHGRDWTALKETYRPWCMMASTKTDFQDMFNFMLGQLDASHMGLYGSDRAETQRERTGLLGVELKTQANGMLITHVVPESPADRAASKLSMGDVITSVNGTPVGGQQNFYALLINQADEEVLLTVETGGKSREVVIRPTSSLRSALYAEWVDNRAKLTETYSNGRLGYIHIQGMNWPSFERFERELMAAGLGKEGIVIDVRYNGGGWTTDYLMAVLNVQQHAYTIPRGAAETLEQNKQFAEHYPYGERLPLVAWTRPAVALCNQNSYSNAEIFSHAFKTLDRGTLVGTPTFGAVISTGGAGMIDGSYVRLPFRAWYVKATGENMEHGPAVPDIVVENAPDSKANDRDEQLKAAVDALLKQIGTR